MVILLLCFYIVYYFFMALICLIVDTEGKTLSWKNMGKRKSRAKPPPKKRMDKLDTVFSCPFCNHGSSVECPHVSVIFLILRFYIWNSYIINLKPTSLGGPIVGSMVEKWNQIETKIVFDFSDMKNSIGEATCRICQVNFSTTVTGMYSV